MLACFKENALTFYYKSCKVTPVSRVVNVGHYITCTLYIQFFTDLRESLNISRSNGFTLKSKKYLINILFNIKPASVKLLHFYTSDKTVKMTQILCLQQWKNKVA